MKLYRYCSFMEFISFYMGVKLKNVTPHTKEKVFWFFPVEDMTMREIKQDIHNLTGIVTTEVLMIVDIPSRYLKKRTGKYTARGVAPSQFSFNLFETPQESRTEYTIETYSSKICKLIKAFHVYRKNPYTWKFVKINLKELV